MSPIRFSLFFFSADPPQTGPGKYDLLLAASRFADEHGFEAVWTPERHFQGFGGIYANPAITAAALAMATRRVSLRAGSVILPLHNPVRVAEDWAMVDNLSGGRAGLSFGTGWNVQDFVLAPNRYANRRQELRSDLDTVRSLWAGVPRTSLNGAGRAATYSIHPRPVQAEIPIWMTAESPETFIYAGEIGANVLTALMHQTVEAATVNIKAYRQALARAGFEPWTRQVTLMQHALLAEDRGLAEDLGRAAYLQYVRSNLVLQQANAAGLNGAVDDLPLDEEDVAALADIAFERHLNATGLIGSRETLTDRIDLWSTMGVDEVACLVDFTSDMDVILRTLRLVAERCDA